MGGHEMAPQNPPIARKRPGESRGAPRTPGARKRRGAAGVFVGRLALASAAGQPERSSDAWRSEAPRGSRSVRRTPGARKRRGGGGYRVMPRMLGAPDFTTPPLSTWQG